MHDEIEQYNKDFLVTGVRLKCISRIKRSICVFNVNIDGLTPDLLSSKFRTISGVCSIHANVVWKLQSVCKCYGTCFHVLL